MSRLACLSPDGERDARGGRQVNVQLLARGERDLVALGRQHHDGSCAGAGARTDRGALPSVGEATDERAEGGASGDLLDVTGRRGLRLQGERVRGDRVGLALVLGLMLFATWNDLQRLRVFNFVGGLFS